MVAAGKQSTNGSRPKTIKLDKIRLDGDTQSRKELDEDVVKEYSDLMKDGVEFPPLGVVFDGSDYWLYDGFHRRFAAVKANVKEFRCIVVNGTREDARWFSYSANITHGLKRSPEDKRKAVISALKHPKGAKLSDHKIAEHVGVSHVMVGKYRNQLEVTSNVTSETERTGVDGRTINTANIGRKPEKKPCEGPNGEEVRQYDSDGNKNANYKSPASVTAGECAKGGDHDRGDDGTCTKCKDPPVSTGNEFLDMELAPAVDAWGDEVTGELRHVFQVCAEFKEKRQQLTNLKTWITQRMNHPGCAVLASGESRIKTDIDNLDSELKFATPYCVCVYCKNKMPKLANCNACKGRGWITQEIYKQAPKELKRA